MQKIDFEIIWKKYHTSINREEREQLQAWLDADKRHRQYFDDVNRFYSEGSVFDRNPVDSEIAWENILKQLQINRKKRYANLVYITSSIAAGIFVIIYLLFNIPREQAVPAITESIQSIQPGAKKAMLILDDGSTFDLSVNQELSIKEGGTRISRHGNGIEYIQENTSTKVLKYNTLRIPRGGEFFIILSDGTKVWLNSETVLRYPVRFSGNERKVELIGEAFFEVIKNKEKPFRVVSDKQIVEVFGTSFNISSYADDDLIYTTLISGRVDVYLKDNCKVRQTLLPNFQTRLCKNSGQLTQQKVETDQYTAWKEGRFVFVNMPLSVMMNTLSKWYNVDVTFENEKLKDIRFTGDLKRYDNFEKVVAIIEKTQEVKIETIARKVIIK